MALKMRLSSFFTILLGIQILHVYAGQALPPGSLNIKVDPIPDHLLGTSINYIDLPATSNSGAGTSLAPGIPSDYVAPGPNSRINKRGTTVYQPDSTVYPYRTIGKVFVGHIDNYNNYIVDYKISGVLVGNSTILLSSQYVPGIWNNSKWYIRFVPAYSSSSTPYGDSYVNTCSGYKPAGVNGHDYIVCQLYTPLGTTVGWLGYYTPSIEKDYFNPWYSAGGYPTQGQRDVLSVQDGIPVMGYSGDGTDGVILQTTPFNSVDGWTGGPLWDPNTLQVTAVLSGNTWDSKGQQWMNWAGGSALSRWVQYGRDNWDRY